MQFVKVLGLIGMLCQSLAVSAQNFTHVDLQLAAYLEHNNLTDYNVTAVRVRDSDIQITSLGCSIAVRSISRQF